MRFVLGVSQWCLKQHLTFTFVVTSEIFLYVLSQTLLLPLLPTFPFFLPKAVETSQEFILKSKTNIPKLWANSQCECELVGEWRDYLDSDSAQMIVNKSTLEKLSYTLTHEGISKYLWRTRIERYVYYSPLFKTFICSFFTAQIFHKFLEILCMDGYNFFNNMNTFFLFIFINILKHHQVCIPFHIFTLTYTQLKYFIDIALNSISVAGFVQI